MNIHKAAKLGETAFKSEFFSWCRESNIAQEIDTIVKGVALLPVD